MAVNREENVRSLSSRGAEQATALDFAEVAHQLELLRADPVAQQEILHTPVGGDAGNIPTTREQRPAGPTENELNSVTRNLFGGDELDSIASNLFGDNEPAGPSM